MYIRGKSYGVHMETLRRCVTDWARGTNKLCRIYPSATSPPICRYRSCIVRVYRSICIVALLLPLTPYLPGYLSVLMIVLSTYALFESSQISVIKPNVEFGKLVCFIENRDQNPFFPEAFTIYPMLYVDMNTRFTQSHTFKVLYSITLNTAVV